MGSWFWWIRNLVIGAISIFFFVFGVEVLVGSYSLNNPQLFIMNFFSGSLITLISLTGIIYPVFRIYALIKTHGDVQKDV